MKQKLGRGPAALTGSAVLATPLAAADDETGAAVRIEQLRHERAGLDSEGVSVRWGAREAPMLQ